MLFKLYSVFHKKEIKIFGVWQDKFLVYLNSGWVWVPMKHFTPNSIVIHKDHPAAIFHDGMKLPDAMPW
jgi:hypothetical protein